MQPLSFLNSNNNNIPFLTNENPANQQKTHLTKPTTRPHPRLLTSLN